MPSSVEDAAGREVRFQRSRARPRRSRLDSGSRSRHPARRRLSPLQPRECCRRLRHENHARDSRSAEHLSNTPRQIFIAQALGYPLPEYAHVPVVAEPGSKNKLSKRKIADYLKHPDFRKLYEHGERIAKALGMATAPETFNPVIVDFYERVGYLPEAILNYIVLLGWSLDDKTEFFSVQELIDAFSLERINKAPASFDARKLFAFQERYMNLMPLDEKVRMTAPYLTAGGPPARIS